MIFLSTFAKHGCAVGRRQIIKSSTKSYTFMNNNVSETRHLSVFNNNRQSLLYTAKGSVTIIKRGMRAHPQTNPDALTRDEVIDKLICNLTFDGEKHKAEKIVRSTLLLLKNDIMKDEHNEYYDKGITASGVLHQAVENSRPLVTVAREKRRSTVKLTPKAIRYSEQQKMSLKFYSKYLLNRRSTGAHAEKTLFELLKKAYRRQGPIIQIRNEVHKVADAARTQL